MAAELIECLDPAALDARLCEVHDTHSPAPTTVYCGGDEEIGDVAFGHRSEATVEPSTLETHGVSRRRPAQVCVQVHCPHAHPVNWRCRHPPGPAKPGRVVSC